MTCEANRINRKEVNPDIMKAYEADKDFFITFYRSYVVEGLMELLSLGDLNDVPPDCPSPNSEEHVRNAWSQEMLGKFVDEYVLPAWSGRGKQHQVNHGMSENYSYSIKFKSLFQTLGPYN